MNTLILPNPVGEVSDGYHTFNELYEHRCTLFLALMQAHPQISWISTKHHDGSSFGDWFIAGMKLPTGDVSYHLPARMWSFACETGAKVLPHGIEWDGHTSQNVVERIQKWICSVNAAPCLSLKIMNTDKLTAAEAVFGFAAWLTTKEGDTLMGRSHDAAPIACLCKEFMEANSLNEPREDWHHNLIHPLGK